MEGKRKWPCRRLFFLCVAYIAYTGATDQDFLIEMSHLSQNKQIKIPSAFQPYAVSTIQCSNGTSSTRFFSKIIAI